MNILQLFLSVTSVSMAGLSLGFFVVLFSPLCAFELEENILLARKTKVFVLISRVGKGLNLLPVSLGKLQLKHSESLCPYRLYMLIKKIALDFVLNFLSR